MMTSNAPLALKYRATTRIGDIRGQPHVTRYMTNFVKNPHSRAFLFAGSPGIGKTLTGYAIANELGCNTGGNEGDRILSGFVELPSGIQNKASVIEELNRLHYRPFNATGYRVLMFNECDKMSDEAKTVLLDGLERLPQSCIVIFTTNNPQSLDFRFRDRCLCFDFTSNIEDLREPAKELVKAIWQKETGRKTGAPTLNDLGCGYKIGSISFRGLLTRLECHIVQNLYQPT